MKRRWHNIHAWFRANRQIIAIVFVVLVYGGGGIYAAFHMPKAASDALSSIIQRRLSEEIVEYQVYADPAHKTELASMKDWVTASIQNAITSLPRNTSSDKNIFTSTPASSSVVNNYYETKVYHSSSRSSSSIPVDLSLQSLITTNASVDGELSVAGLVTLSGGLDLATGILTAGGLSFALPSLSDTLIGVSSPATLAGKTISALDNTITDLSALNFAEGALDDLVIDASSFLTTDSVDTLSNKVVSALDNTLSDLNPDNFASDVLSQWTNDVGFIARDSVDTLSNKTISTLDNTISGLGAANFATDALSQWTNDIGFITSDSIESLSNKTLSGLENTFLNIPNDATTASVINAVNTIVTRDGNGDFSAGTITADLLGNAESATNALFATTASFADAVLDGVYTTSSYTDPSWITSLDATKLVGTIIADELSGDTYSIDIVGNAETVTDGLYESGSYADPSWLTTLSGDKLIGTITANAIASGTYAIDILGNAETADSALSATVAGTATLADVATSALNADAVTNGIYTTGSYANPSWLTSLNGAKLIGTVTANAITGGTYGIDISGNATSATSASTALLANVATSALNADTVTSGVYTTGSYANPSWITSLNGNKLTGTITANAISSGTYGIDVSGNAGTVTNGVYTSGSYNNPSWLTGLAGSKLTGTVTANALSSGSYGIDILGNAGSVTDGVYTSGSYANPSWITSFGGNKLTGTVTANAVASGTYSIDVSGNAATVTNGVYTSGSYNNPSWITGLAGTKLSGTVTATALAAGTYGVDISGNAGTVTNGLYSTGSYANPSWLTSLAGTKLTGVVTATALSAGTYGIDISGNASTVTNGLYTTGSYANPSWITSIDGGKLSGTITANALAVGDYTVGTLSGSNTSVASGTLANTALSGTCIVNLNALGLAAFQSSATITTSHIFYNSTRSRHSRITSVSTCTDGSGNPWRVLTLSDTISGNASGDSYTIYNPGAGIGNSGSGFFNNLYAINLRGLVSTLSGGFDVAEEYPSVDDTLSPGELVSFDPQKNGHITRSTTPYDPLLLGIVTTNPGLTLGNETEGTWIKVALAGRVPVLVSNENGHIAIGDHLTSSSIPGVAMKSTTEGPIIGKALENFDEGEGRIMAFVAFGETSGSPERELMPGSAPLSSDDLSGAADDGAITITSKVRFEGGITTDTLGALGDMIFITSDTTFVGRAYWNSDTAGFATVPQGARSADVVYERSYTQVPIVNATIIQSGDSSAFFNEEITYIITENKTQGFTILLNKPAPTDVQFGWSAFAVSGLPQKESGDNQTDEDEEEENNDDPDIPPILPEENPEPIILDPEIPIPDPLDESPVPPQEETLPEENKTSQTP